MPNLVPYDKFCPRNIEKAVEYIRALARIDQGLAVGGAFNFCTFSPCPNARMEPNRITLELLVNEIETQ